MADIVFMVYILLCVSFICFSFSSTGKELQWEFLAFRETQKYMRSKGLRWPSEEGLK